MNRADEFMCAEHRAEMEDRAAEIVDRDHLLGIERVDLSAAWREAERLADRAEFARREAERDRDGQRDYAHAWEPG